LSAQLLHARRELAAHLARASARAAAEARPRHPAVHVDAAIVGVAVRLERGVLVRLQQLVGAAQRALGQVRDVDHHASLHQLLHERLAERGHAVVLAPFTGERRRLDLIEEGQQRADRVFAELAHVVGGGASYTSRGLLSPPKVTPPSKAADTPGQSCTKSSSGRC
jgi:hypothetical protein